MPAANLTELLDFEGQFLNAAQAILVASGIAAYIDQQAVKLPLLSTGIGMDVNPAIDELTQIPAPSNWPNGQAAPQEYFRYTGNLEFRVEVPRDASAATITGLDALLSQIRGQIRAAMMRCVMPFTQTNLPYYRVSDIRPNGTATGYEAQRNIDFCSVRFVITWAIQPEAWPAWIES
jgi:hypothetical protein